MSTDMTIHVFEGITIGDVEAFFSNALGSQYFSPIRARDYDARRVASDHIEQTPSVCVGEMSWGDGDPQVVAIKHLIGDNLPVIDEALIGAVAKVYDDAHVLRDERVLNFLDQHYGKNVFTVNW